MNIDAVADEIEIDPAVVEEIFYRRLKTGWRAYIEKLERFVSFDDEIDAKTEAISKAFHFMRILIERKGFQGVTTEEFSECGLDRKCLPRLRYLIFQLENSSPSRPSLPYSQMAGRDRRISSQTEEYEDDFEVEEEDLPTGHPIGEGPLHGRLSYPAKEVVEEIGNDLHSASVTVPFSAPHMHESNSPKINRNRRTAAPDSDSQSKHASSNEYLSKRESKGYSNDAWEDDRIPRRAEPRRLAAGAAGAAAAGESRGVAAGGGISTSDTRVTSTSSSSSAVNSGRRRGKDERWVKEKRWRLGDNIGRGSFGEVFQGMNDKGQLFAVKRLNMVGKRDEVEDLTREISLMKELEHPNIVAYLGSYVDETQGLVYIFQEWVPGGSVAGLLQKYGAFELGAVRTYTRQILHGLVYLHENGIVHRDIKGANVLVTDTGRVPVVKLADFGASTKIVMDQTQDTTTIKGTPYFLAPEVMSTSKYGRKGDIWALGCTMIQMLTGSPPWKEFNIQNLVQLHMLLTGWTKGPPPYNRDITVDAQECLNLCFGKEPEQRPTAAQLLLCSFLAGGDELEDSAEGFLEDSRGHEESGDLSHLRQQMSRASLAAPDLLRPRQSAAAANSSSNTHTGGGTGADDTLADIERRMKERAESNKNNPFAKKQPTASNSSNNQIASPPAAAAASSVLPSPARASASTHSTHNNNTASTSRDRDRDSRDRDHRYRGDREEIDRDGDSKSATDDYFSSSGSGSMSLSLETERARIGSSREAAAAANQYHHSSANRGGGVRRSRSNTPEDIYRTSASDATLSYDYDDVAVARNPFEGIINKDQNKNKHSYPSPGAPATLPIVSSSSSSSAPRQGGGRYDKQGGSNDHRDNPSRGAIPSPSEQYDDISRVPSIGGAERDKLQVLKRRSFTGQSVVGALRGSSNTPRSDRERGGGSRASSRARDDDDEDEEAELDIIRGSTPSGAAATGAGSSSSSSSAQANRYANTPSSASRLHTPQASSARGGGSLQRRGSGGSITTLPSTDRIGTAGVGGARIAPAPNSSSKSPKSLSAAAAGTPTTTSSTTSTSSAYGRRGSNPRQGTAGTSARGSVGSTPRIRTPGGFLESPAAAAAASAAGTSNSGVDDEGDTPWTCYKCNIVCYDSEYCMNCATKRTAFGYTGKKA